MADEQSEDIKELKRRIEAARQDRTNRATLINEVYRLAMPWRTRINSQSRVLTADDVSDILDATLAEALEDFGSDMMATFTPPNEPWVKHEPNQILDAQTKRAIADQIAGWTDWFWDDMADSTFYDAAQECYQDLGAGTMALSVKDFGPSSPVIYEQAQIAEILFDAGPNGLPDGTWYECMVEKRELINSYGMKLNLPEKVRNSTRPSAKFKVLDGTYRLWESKNDIVYRRVVMIEGQIAYDKMIKGAGAANLIVSRWRNDSENPYGIGPAWKACPPQRALIELSALAMANMHKVVDPPVAYSGDGTANVEGGVDAGDWVDLGADFDVRELGTTARFDIAFYEKQELQRAVRRALYQDKPEQMGKTPPTREQWQDERQITQQRFEVPRGKVYREWVIPIVQRHQYLRTMHGLGPQILVKGRGLIRMVPQSPQAKARAFDEIAKAERILALAAQYLPQQLQIVVDLNQTLINIKEMLSDRLITLRSPQDIQKMLAQLAQQSQQVQAATAPHANPGGAPAIAGAANAA